MNPGIGRGPEAGLEGPLRLLALGAVVVFAIFLLRLVQLQVIEGDELSLRSERNFVRSERVEAPRGDILDRHGAVLATTRPAFGLGVIPSEVRQAERTFAVLGRLLGDDPAALRERVGTPRGRARYQPVRVRADLAFEELARVETHRYALPGVVTDVRARRDYVEGSLAAHLLGTIGEVTSDQLETRAFAGYRAGEIVGQSGIEALLEPALRGRAGGRNVVVDVAGREMDVIGEVEPVRGGSVALTLDIDLQRVAAAALRDAQASAGAIVALDPRNGDVLALVSHPAYDPNAFAGGIEPAAWKALRDDPWKPLQNRAVAGQYPPGSTYKALLAAAVLEEGVVGLGERIFCPGHFTLGRRTYRCWKPGGHGWMAVHDALKQSCDVFFYTVGLRLGIDRQATFARAFGLGRTTGSPFRDEQPGLVPTRAWKEKRFGERWMDGETVSSSIGQGFDLVTPLQLAVAFAAIANGGKVLEPRLVLSGDAPPRVREEVPVRPEHLETVRSALEAVVMEPGGTGGRARVPDQRIAGKTGTAQVVGLKHTEGVDDRDVPIRYRDHAWFAAFAPADAPEIVVTVLVEHGGGGGANAAPLAQKVLAAFFAGREVQLAAD